MQFNNLIAIVFILLMIMVTGYYASQRNHASLSNRQRVKQLTDDDSDVTESEPELEIKEKAVDKMELIPEENDDDDVDDNKAMDANDNNKNKKKKKRKKQDEVKDEEEDDLSDSDEYSMQRMVEEYQKSRTLAKKFAEIIEDISDTFKRKSIEIKKKFEPEAPPAVIRPMSFAEQQAKLSKPKMQKSDKNANSKDKKVEIVVQGKQQKAEDFDVNFDDEKQVEMNEDEDEQQVMVKKEENMEQDMVDSEDEFGEFDANKFEEFGDLDSMDNMEEAVEIVMDDKDRNDVKDEPVEIVMEDEKIKEISMDDMTSDE